MAAGEAGRGVAQGRYSSFLHIWNPATGALERDLSPQNWGDELGLTSADMFTLSDGQPRLLTGTIHREGGMAGPVVVWNLVTGAEERKHRKARGRAGCTYVGADGKARLVTTKETTFTNRAHSVHILNLATGQQEQALTGFTGSVEVLCAFTGRDGRTRIAAGCHDGELYIWDPVSGVRKQELAGHNGGVTALCVVKEPSGRTQLASGGSDGRLRLWDLDTGTKTQDLVAHRGSVNTLCVFRDSDGRTNIATGGSDGRMLIWDPHFSAIQKDLGTHTDGVRSICAFLGTDGRTRLAMACVDGAVHICDTLIARRQQPDRQTTLVTAISTFADPHGHTWLATGGDDGAIHILDPATGAPVQELQAHTEPIVALAGFIGTDGRTRLASVGKDGRTRLLSEVSEDNREAVRIWDLETGSLDRELTSRADDLDTICVFIDDDGKPLLATINFDGKVRLWDPQTGHRQRKIRKPSEWTLRTFPGADGKPRVASSRSFETALAAKTGRLDRTGLVDGLPNQFCVFPGKDKQWLLATWPSDGGLVRIWDMETGEQQRILRGGGSNGMCAIIGADGRRQLVTGQTDRTVRIRDLETGAHVVTIPVYHRVHDVCAIRHRIFVRLDAGLLALDIENLPSGPAAPRSGRSQ